VPRGDPDTESRRPGREFERRHELDGLAIDAGVDRRGRGHFETRRGPCPSQTPADAGRVEDDDAEPAAVQRGSGAGELRRAQRVRVVRDEYDGRVLV
jgi:hypothetical protein